jgi:hypothetical protein
MIRYNAGEPDEEEIKYDDLRVLERVQILSLPKSYSAKEKKQMLGKLARIRDRKVYAEVDTEELDANGKPVKRKLYNYYVNIVDDRDEFTRIQTRTDIKRENLLRIRGMTSADHDRKYPNQTYFTIPEKFRIAPIDWSDRVEILTGEHAGEPGMVATALLRAENSSNPYMEYAVALTNENGLWICEEVPGLRAHELRRIETQKEACELARMIAKQKASQSALHPFEFNLLHGRTERGASIEKGERRNKKTRFANAK